MRWFGIVVIALNTISFFSYSTEPDSSRSIFRKGLDQVKLQKAKHLLFIRDFNGALDEYRELYRNNKDNPLLNVRMGQCYFEVRNYEDAVKYFAKAHRLSPDVDEDLPLLYGKTLHRLGELDKALVLYEGYKNTLDDRKRNLENFSDVNKEIESVHFAKEKMKNPMKVEVINLGRNINSPFDDYGPSLSADGKTLVFTSRRPDSKGGFLDPADQKFYEDIYISVWNEEKNSWNQAEGIQGRLNTDFHDGCLSISPEGDKIYVYRNYGEAGSGQIYVSSLSSTGKWRTPQLLGETINTSYWESSASLTADGSKLYFVSERKGGLGRGDIYVVERTTRTEFGEAQNLGPAINTAGDEKMVFIHPKGDMLFFSSDGHTTMGGYDIFVSLLINGQWTEPVNLGYPINSVDDDVNFVLTANNKKAYYSGFKQGGIGESDIYEIDLSRYNLISRLKKNLKKPD